MKGLLAVLLLAAGALAPARAETVNCTRITSLPATLTQQGVYCLKGDLGTSLVWGSAVRIEANNVTLDCNGFKIGGLAAGDESIALGISANDRQNITVRNCAIRGFYRAISLTGGLSGGHLIADNRIDQSLHTGIHVLGDGNEIARNRILSTGGFPGSASSYGIQAQADIVDNTIDTVFALGSEPILNGIRVLGDGAVVRGNTVRNLFLGQQSGALAGIMVEAERVSIDGNVVVQVGSSAVTTGYGIRGGLWSICTGNRIHFYSTPSSNCDRGGGNYSWPPF